jgi:hypothetical protein
VLVVQSVGGIIIALLLIDESEEEAVDLVSTMKFIIHVQVTLSILRALIRYRSMVDYIHAPLSVIS